MGFFKVSGCHKKSIEYFHLNFHYCISLILKVGTENAKEAKHTHRLESQLLSCQFC
jgi:hypothetical protein